MGEFSDYYQPVDKRSRKAMTNFLKNHSRYSTLNSWNGLHSYANNVKLRNLKIPHNLVGAAYEILSQGDVHDELGFEIDDWTSDHHGQYTAGFNGRSGGYVVLYRSHYETSDHKSICRNCGQKNFKTIEETGNNICGKCGADGRRNLSVEARRVLRVENVGVDQDTDFSDLSMDELRERVELVQSFDELCDTLAERFMDFVKNYEVVEEEVLVPTKVKVLREKGEEDAENS